MGSVVGSGWEYKDVAGRSAFVVTGNVFTVLEDAYTYPLHELAKSYIHVQTHRSRFKRCEKSSRICLLNWCISWFSLQTMWRVTTGQASEV